MPLRHQASDHVRALLAAVRLATDPFNAVAAAVRRQPPRFKRPALIAVGKAAPRMYEGFMDALPGVYESIMVVPEGVAASGWAIRADHPVPTTRSLHAAERLVRFVTAIASGVAGHDGFVVLLSGGASSLLSLPMPGIDFQRYASTIAELLKWGIDIHTLNTIRKHCEQLKGGRLATLMQPLPCDNYMLSDVIGDDLSAIGSGPTVGDPTTYDDAHAPFDHQLEFSIAADVLLPHIQRARIGEFPETPKPSDAVFDHVRSTIVGSNLLALEAAADAAHRIGFNVHSTAHVIDDASQAGRRLAEQARSASPATALIFGGETTVDASGDTGRGGRNQELALAAAVAIDGHPNITIAAFATDGVDGPTDAAGAAVTGDTCRQARAIDLDPEQALARHDSYTFFDALDKAGFPPPPPHLIRTGPTGTNVNDIAFALIY